MRLCAQKNVGLQILALFSEKFSSKEWEANPESTPRGTYYFEVSNRKQSSRYDKDERPPLERRRRERSADRSETALRGAGGMVAGDSVWLDMRSEAHAQRRRSTKSPVRGRRSYDQRQDRPRRSRERRSRSGRRSPREEPLSRHSRRASTEQATRKSPDPQPTLAQEQHDDASNSDSDFSLSISEYDIDFAALDDDDDVSDSRSASPRMRSVLVRPNHEAGAKEEERATKSAVARKRDARGDSNKTDSVSNNRKSTAIEANHNSNETPVAAKRVVLEPRSEPPPRKRFSPITWEESGSDKNKDGKQVRVASAGRSYANNERRWFSQRGRRY